MNNKYLISWKETEQIVLSIARQISSSNWKPDVIVGVTRGGAVPAVMLSQYLNLPMIPLPVSLRDHSNTTSDVALACQALGYVPADLRSEFEYKEQHDSFKKNILVVDDINDTGATIAWIKDDWQANCLDYHLAWDNVWGVNVRFACLVNNVVSQEEIDYTGLDINKERDPVWIEFPWEEFWTKQ